MAKSDDLVKYITQQVVTYIETPKEVRQQVKAMSKEQRESWQTRWFGMLPLATRMLIDQVKPKK
ncbi:YqzE family protein [Paenibacillus alginolyticus]|uniref:YqzE family protein n=1 Tax=Paenibacillus alginolyticus TaxID=59839 RepID=A0ABT4GPX5_9BACL|nr:YqzE family protein [Paenibacillus alginolyticus]MCY9670581.1 YqzE family protein [Paenibacillus alginolyticus]MCY9698049.1 YqzE family protein [Paenibacillus alginolyticus]MEC0145288.1 YqzE family protein [Paenibacillus alginolyticus]